MKRVLLQWSIWTAIGLLAGGCNSSVVVTSQFNIPTPVLEPLPIDVAVHYDKSLELIELENKITDLGRFKFDIGASAITVFDTLFDAMFRSTQRVASLEDVPPGTQGTIVIRVDEVELSVPGQGGGDYFEVWFKFEMDVTDHEGALVHTWKFPAYGRASHDDTARVDYFDPESVLKRSLEVAMRDAGALVALYFSQQPPITAWIESLK